MICCGHNKTKYAFYLFFRHISSCHHFIYVLYLWLSRCADVSYVPLLVPSLGLATRQSNQQENIETTYYLLLLLFFFRISNFTAIISKISIFVFIMFSVLHFLKLRLHVSILQSSSYVRFWFIPITPVPE